MSRVAEINERARSDFYPGSAVKFENRTSARDLVLAADVNVSITADGQPSDRIDAPRSGGDTSGKFFACLIVEPKNATQFSGDCTGIGSRQNVCLAGVYAETSLI
jgi:hypothetical protein